MSRRIIYAALAAFTFAAAHPAAAQVESVYTKLDLDKGCEWDPLEGLTQEEKDQLQGNTAVCTGLPEYPVHFAESDLRQYVAFGGEAPEGEWPGGFGEFNHIGGTIEWRLDAGRPYATILRRFIENTDQQTSEVSDASRGQVLVISTIVQPDNVGGSKSSCAAGYVDAKANGNANELARQVADMIARNFQCGSELPKFHGERGPLSGNPMSIAQ